MSNLIKIKRTGIVTVLIILKENIRSNIEYLSKTYV
jgi:hypothetical protein